MAKLRNFDKNHTAHKNQNIYHLTLYRKDLLTAILEITDLIALAHADEGSSKTYLIG